jgi:hypothetical protein
MLFTKLVLTFIILLVALVASWLLATRRETNPTLGDALSVGKWTMFPWTVIPILFVWAV